MQKKRLHPIAVVKWVAIALLLATWGLGTTGFASGNYQYYRWAIFAFGALLCVAFAPLAVFVLYSLLRKR
jgi:hypothetical protein